MKSKACHGFSSNSKPTKVKKGIGYICMIGAISPLISEIAVLVNGQTSNQSIKSKGRFVIVAHIVAHTYCFSSPLQASPPWGWEIESHNVINSIWWPTKQRIASDVRVIKYQIPQNSGLAPNAGYHEIYYNKLQVIFRYIEKHTGCNTHP